MGIITAHTFESLLFAHEDHELQKSKKVDLWVKVILSHMVFPSSGMNFHHLGKKNEKTNIDIKLNHRMWK